MKLYKSYIVFEDGKYQKRTVQNQSVPGALCECQNDTDVEVIDVVDDVNELTGMVLGKKIVISEDKVAAKVARLLAEAQAKVITDKFVARTKKRQFGEQLIDKISVMNETKTMSLAEVDSFMTNPLIVNLREHLWAGNISTFISKLQQSDVSAFFSNEEKSQVIQECQAFLTSIGE